MWPRYDDDQLDLLSKTANKNEPRYEKHRALPVDLIRDVFCHGALPETDSVCEIHTTPEEFESGGFTLKKHQILSVHTRPEEFKNATESPVIFCLTKPRAGKSHDYGDYTVFENLRFQPVQTKRKAIVFKFLRFEVRFRKAHFSCRISVDGRPNRRNKAAFSNSSGVVWTLPKK